MAIAAPERAVNEEVLQRARWTPNSRSHLDVARSERPYQFATDGTKCRLFALARLVKPLPLMPAYQQDCQRTVGAVGYKSG
jgi:hypothetical protein